MWAQLWKYVKEFVRSCDVYAQAKNFCHCPHGLFQPLSILTSSWSSISMDFITHLPPSSSYDSILVVVGSGALDIHDDSHVIAYLQTSEILIKLAPKEGD